MTDSKGSKQNIYNHSKLYKLQCEDGYMYFGCTTQALSVRLGEHKKRSKRDINRNVYSHINNIGWDRVRIVLISEHNLENREQLLREEDELITKYKDDPYCLNMHRSFTGLNKQEYQKIYREDNKDKIQEKKKEWIKSNKDKMQVYFKEYHLKNQEVKINNSREWYKNNKDRKKECDGQKIECICGIITNYGNRLRHERSKKHINYLSQVASSISEPIDNINMVNQDVVSCTSDSPESCL